MLEKLQAEIDQHIQELARLQGIEEEAKRKKREEAAKVAKSRRAVMRYLGNLIDVQIKLGNLTPGQVQEYLTQYQKEYGQDAVIAEYLAIVARLLTHEFYGVECTTHRVGNGGLIWKGQSYSGAYELYLAIIDQMAGIEPLESQVWFNYLLTQVFEEDGTFLAAEVLIPRWKTDFVPKLIRLVEADRSRLVLPDIEDLTTEDALYLQYFMDGQ
ncbi:hypothetical protein [Nostoc sp. PA-18-2419]|uniref:hypothetical protein n=1 Tax=Nostoc sp. PA-18-2419 TaxID=2575443 RepID=UPI0011099810|nr:hypothetical protein [Nostoc sp. PA-18-2419]